MVAARPMSRPLSDPPTAQSTEGADARSRREHSRQEVFEKYQPLWKALAKNGRKPTDE